MADDFVLREFVCKHCGHKVVVNPALPKDYDPNVCCQCYEQIVKPQMQQGAVNIMSSLIKLLGD